MRIGIFGGSFDPIHLGHLVLAELAREQCRLDEVRFVPAAIPPHKQTRERAPDDARVDMIELALGGHPSMRTWDVELRRGGVSYTVDTLRALHESDPAAELFLLMGADSLEDLATWRAPEEICELACLIVVHRPGSAPVDFAPLNQVTSEQRLQLFREHVVDIPQMELSSTEMRRRISARQTIRYQTPRAVEEYIRSSGLYR